MKIQTREANASASNTKLALVVMVMGSLFRSCIVGGIDGEM